MRSLGNFIWFICAGLWSWISWTVVGLILCLTVIGIPFGLQCFKIGNFGLFPFGKRMETTSRTGHFLLNIIWFFLAGWELAVLHLGTAFLLCLTIIGIPFAKQALKLAQISLFPFGVKVYQS